jgi:hypothetical protein
LAPLDAGDPVVEEGASVDADLFEPQGKAFEEPTSETEQVDPTANEPDRP